MKIEAKPVRLMFVSPWFLTVFLVVPVLAILKVRFQIPLQVPNVKYILLANNITFAVVVALRLVYHLVGLRRATRYGARVAAGCYSIDLSDPPAETRETLETAGFRFNESGSYGEKADLGYLGTVIAYAGLLLVLATGSFDNLYQFSGTLFDGQGRATDLNKLESYRDLITGPLTGSPKKLPQMKILRQINPSPEYPRGATEVAFLFSNGDAKKAILKCPDPFELGPYDIFMSKMVYEPKLLVTLDKDHTVFSGSVMLDPLVTPENGFSFYGAFVYKNLDGEAYYQPEKSRLKFLLRQGPLVLVDKELIFQVDRMQSSGNIDFNVEKMGVWSELHVVRRRHLSLLAVGAAVFLVGLIMRLVIGRQRVWLENVYGNCRVNAVGTAAKQALSRG